MSKIITTSSLLGKMLEETIPSYKDAELQELYPEAKPADLEKLKLSLREAVENPEKFIDNTINSDLPEIQVKPKVFDNKPPKMYNPEKLTKQKIDPLKLNLREINKESAPVDIDLNAAYLAQEISEPGKIVTAGKDFFTVLTTAYLYASTHKNDIEIIQQNGAVVAVVNGSLFSYCSE